MNLQQVAKLAVSRLGLPVPMAKLTAIQAIAKALDDEAMAASFAEALGEWVSSRNLESECLEAICPLIVATRGRDVADRIRRLLARPSIASDLLLSVATGSPILVSTWTGCHSNPVQKLQNVLEEEQALRSGTFVPPLLTHRLEELEQNGGHPFVRQWAFEYSVLASRYGEHGDGHLDYFFGSEREQVGQFVARRGHMARSAYLRTLACAVEHWDLPEFVARRYSAAVAPAEPIFLQLAPQAAPTWADLVQKRTVEESADGPRLAQTVIQFLEHELQRRLMHCSLAVVDEPGCHVQLEVFAVAAAAVDLDVSGAVNFHTYLLGKASPGRDGIRAFVAQNMGDARWDALGFVPILLPLIGSMVGYLQADLLGIVPYMPAATKSLPDLELVPSTAGAALMSQGRAVGAWDWWLWNWKPGHPCDWHPPNACCTSLVHDAAEQMARDVGGALSYVWRLTTWRREQSYGKWTESQELGLHSNL
jgi:hypothetical protein